MSDPETKFDRAFASLKFLEYNNREDKFLHTNANEKSLTLAGIYQHYYRDSEIINWDFVEKIIKVCSGDYTRASILLFHDKRINQQVYRFFKKEYWQFNKLDEIQSDIVCNKIFLTAVVFGSATTIKIAQQAVGMNKEGVDGIIGKNTIRAINNYNPEMFEKHFVERSKNHIDKIIEHNPKLALNRNGWINRINYKFDD